MSLETAVPYLFEFFGTFIFLSVILSVGEALPIGLTLAALIYFGQKYASNAYNPAVSFALYLEDKIDGTRLIGFIFLKIVAALCAWKFYNYMKNVKN